MSEIQILVVEDDHELNNQLCRLLTDAGYSVDCCFDGESGLISALSGRYQLALLDVMLPNRDGFSVLNIIRKSNQLPVLMLTAKGAEEERITGLSFGADDYVSKPFNPTELLLRSEALLRRSLAISPNSDNAEQKIELDSLSLCNVNNRVYVDEKEIEFTPIQFKLLWELAINRGDVLSKAYLYQRVLNKTLGAYDRSLDMHLSRVRRKLNDANWQGDRVQTCHGQGYCIT